MAVQTGTRRAHFIGGAWRESVSGEWFETKDPATGETLAEVARGGEGDIDLAVRAARDAFATWGIADGVVRARLLRAMADRILAEADDLARMETLDNGKPLRQARADVWVAARYFEFYAGIADKIGGRTIPVPGEFFDFTLREPIGVAGIIVPWNYPLQITARGIAAALAAGCTVVIKPAEETPLTALELARIAHEVGVPAGVVNVVTGYGDEAGAALAGHPGINHLTFTGSVEVGSEVMRAAARNIVPVTLELGGKSPNVVFASANLDRAIPIIVNSIIQNAGQTCSAGSRLLVESSVHVEVVQRMLRQFGSIRAGAGIEDPELGPLVSARQSERVRGYIDLAEQEGASVLTASQAPDGNFVAPTVLDGVTSKSRLFHEEIFGPVVAVTSFTSEAEAVELANATEYGLVAAVWTGDVGQAYRVARGIRAGQVFVNSYGAGGGVEMPFGGYGKSGFGREKGLEGLEQYLQVKNVSIYVGED